MLYLICMVCWCLCSYNFMHMCFFRCRGHGEWVGAWCDSSDTWTRWWKQTLNWSGIVEDGRFWMSFSDFLEYFHNVYVCRLLPHRQSIYTRWEGITAAGPQNPRQNPTFIVKSPRPARIWIELEQDSIRQQQATSGTSTSSSSSGYAYINFYVMQNGGKRVDKIERAAIKGWANGGLLKNDRQVSAEVSLEASNEPYTIVCCTKQAGFETGFSLSIFSPEPVIFTMLPPDKNSDSATATAVPTVPVSPREIKSA